MIKIVGNSLNSTNKKILDKMNKMDFEFIRREVLCQIQNGAQYIGLNAVSLLNNEFKFLSNAVPIIESAGASCMVLSNNVQTLIDILDVSQEELIIGPVEYDREKVDRLIEPVMKKNAKMIAHIRDKDSGNGSPEESLLIAQIFVDYLLDSGVKRENILLDPVVCPLEENLCYGRNFLNTLELFKLDFPQVKTIANIFALSEGLPRKHLITSYFVSLAIAKGLDFVITNILENSIKESIITTLSIMGKDKNLNSYLNYCRNYRENKQKGLIKDGRPEN